VVERTLIPRKPLTRLNTTNQPRMLFLTNINHSVRGSRERRRCCCVSHTSYYNHPYVSFGKPGGTRGNVHIKLSLLFFTPCCGLELGELVA
jgi:hypothetical protein